MKIGRIGRMICTVYLFLLVIIDVVAAGFLSFYLPYSVLNDLRSFLQRMSLQFPQTAPAERVGEEEGGCSGRLLSHVLPQLSLEYVLVVLDGFVA